LKCLFDSKNLFNPNVILSDTDLLQNLRPVVNQKDVVTAFDWTSDISFFYAAEKCNGAGVCRKSSGGTMCPSYRATRSEKFSTRGRANLLRKALQSSNPLKSLKSSEIRRALSLCLSCKACKSECPANVDMAKLKSEYLFQTRNITSYIKTWHIRNLGSILKVGSKAPSIFNFLQSSFVTNKIFGFERLPPSLEEPLEVWWNKNKSTKNNRGTTVWVMVDIFTQYYDVNIGRDLLNFLKKCDVNIKVIPPRDSIVALISHGLLNEAKKAIELVQSQLVNVEDNDFIVGIEPSEALVWRDDAKSLTSNELPKILLFEELLLELNQLNLLPKFNASNSKVWVYEHCHQKSLAETSNLIKALGLIPELKIKIIDGGCCGMAGEFGYKHSKISKKIAHNSLDDYIVKIRNQDILIATGTSCRNQILNIFKIQSIHLPSFFINSLKS